MPPRCANNDDTHNCTQAHTSKRPDGDKNDAMLAEQSSDDGLASAVDQQQEQQQQQQQQQLTAQQLQYLQQLLRKNNDALLAAVAAEGNARNARSTRSADVYAAVMQRHQGQAAHDGAKASEVTNMCSILGALAAATQQTATPEQTTKDGVERTPAMPVDSKQARHNGQQQQLLPLQKRDMTTPAAAAAHGGAKTTAFVATPVPAQATPTGAAVALPFAAATAPPYALSMMGGMPAPMHTMPPSMMQLPAHHHGFAQPPLQYLPPPPPPMFPSGTLHPAMYAHAPPPLPPPPPPMPAAGGGGSFGGVNGYVSGHAMLSGVMPPYGVGVPGARAEGVGAAMPPLPFSSPDLLAAMSQAAAAARPSAEANMTAIMSALAAQTQLMLRRQQVYEQQLALMRELLAQQQMNNTNTSKNNNNNNSDNDGKSNSKVDKQGDVCGGTSCAGDSNGSSSRSRSTSTAATATPSHQHAKCPAATATSLLPPPTATSTRSTHDGTQLAVHGAVHDEVACATTTTAVASTSHTADANSSDMMHLWNNLHFDMDDNAYSGNDTGNYDAAVYTQATAAQSRAQPQAPLPCCSGNDNDDDDDGDGDDAHVADVVGRLAQHNDAVAVAGVVAPMCASAAAATTTPPRTRHASHAATLPAALEFLQMLDDTDDDGNNNSNDGKGKGKGKNNNSKQKQQQQQKQQQKQPQKQKQKQKQQSTAFVSQGSAPLRATDTSACAPVPHGTSPPPYTEAVKQRPLPPPPSPPLPPSYQDKPRQQLADKAPRSASDYVKVWQLPVPCTAVANATDKAASQRTHRRKQRKQQEEDKDKDKCKGHDDGGAAATLAKSTTTTTRPKTTMLQCAVKVCAAYCNILREVTQFAVESSEEILLNHCKKTALCRNPAWPPRNERAVHSLLKSCNAPKLLRHLIILSYAHRNPTSLEDLKAHWTEYKVAYDPVFAAYYLYVKSKCNMRLCIRHNSHHNIHGNTDGRCNYAEQRNIDRCRYEHLCLFCGKDTHGWYDENNCKDYQHLVYEARRLGVTEDDMDTLLRGMEGGRVTGL